MTLCLPLILGDQAVGAIRTAHGSERAAAVIIASVVGDCYLLDHFQPTRGLLLSNLPVVAVAAAAREMMFKTLEKYIFDESFWGC